MAARPTYLEHANLAGNAIKFTSEEEVLIRITEAGGRIRFEVIDTGIGISPENQRKIFEAFTQEDASTTRRFGGTGLGLSISLKLVQALGGEITVQSELGHGSTFCFEVELPASEDGAPDERQ